MNSTNERTPKYVQIKDAIRQEIKSGELKNGEQIASEAVLTKRFNASKMTVIRALQDLVQEGFLNRVQGKGTFVTQPPADAQVIGVLIPKTNQGIFAKLVPCIENYAQKLGYSIMLCSADDDVEIVLSFARRMIEQKAVGVIAIPPGRLQAPEDNQRWYKLFQSEGIPAILIDRDIPGIDDSILVSINHQEAMSELTRKIKSMGHKRLIFAVNAESQSTTKKKRIQGFLAAANDEDPAAELAEVIEINNEQTFSQTLQDFENAIIEHEPTVILSAHDLIAVQVMSLLRHSHFDMAKDISLAGFDDLDFAEGLGLTTVHQPLEKLGKTAVDLLHKTLSGGSIQSIEMPFHLVMRKSVAPVKPD